MVDFDLNHFGAIDFDLIYKSFFMGDLLRFWFKLKTQWSVTTLAMTAFCSFSWVSFWRNCAVCTQTTTLSHFRKARTSWEYFHNNITQYELYSASPSGSGSYVDDLLKNMATLPIVGVEEMTKKGTQIKLILRIQDGTKILFKPMRLAHFNANFSKSLPLKGFSAPYWSNPPFLISDIRALWRSGLSARAPECQKIKTVG